MHFSSGTYVATVVALALAAVFTGNTAIYLTAWSLSMPWGLALPAAVFMLGILQWPPLVDTRSVALYGAAAFANILAIRSLIDGARRRRTQCRTA